MSVLIASRARGCLHRTKFRSDTGKAPPCKSELSPGTPAVGGAVDVPMRFALGCLHLYGFFTLLAHDVPWVPTGKAVRLGLPRGDPHPQPTAMLTLVQCTLRHDDDAVSPCESLAAVLPSPHARPIPEGVGEGIASGRRDGACLRAPGAEPEQGGWRAGDGSRDITRRRGL